MPDQLLCFFHLVVDIRLFSIIEVDFAYEEGINPISSTFKFQHNLSRYLVLLTVTAYFFDHFLFLLLDTFPTDVGTE